MLQRESSCASWQPGAQYKPHKTLYLRPYRPVAETQTVKSKESKDLAAKLAK